MGKAVEHEEKCPEFKVARENRIIKCMAPDIMKPPIYYFDFVDPEHRTRKFMGVKFESKSMLVCKYCPFCGEEL